MTKKDRPMPIEIEESESILSEIEVAERQLREADAAVETSRVLLKSAKDAQVAKLTRLRELTGKRLEENPLFDQQKEHEAG